jgi:hypothetical protein
MNYFNLIFSIHILPLKMDKFNEIYILFIYSLIFAGLGFILSKGISFLSKKLKKEEKSKNVKSSMLDLMKKTPLIYIKSLSELCGCKIYGKCEYYLPYTSKDRMIKNIIFDAEK